MNLMCGRVGAQLDCPGAEMAGMAAPAAFGAPPSWGNVRSTAFAGRAWKS